MDWLREHWMREFPRQAAPPTVTPRLSEEPIRLLEISAGESSPSDASGFVRGVSPTLAPDEPEEPVDEPPPEPSGLRWSYDPFSSGVASSELLRSAPDRALLARANLLRSLTLAGIVPSEIDSTTVEWWASNFADLQHAIFLEHKPEWSAEARALWLERHEFWKKLYGDDEEWP